MILNIRMMLLALHLVLKISTLIPMTALNSQQSHHVSRVAKMF